MRSVFRRDRPSQSCGGQVTRAMPPPVALNPGPNCHAFDQILQVIATADHYITGSFLVEFFRVPRGSKGRIRRPSLMMFVQKMSMIAFLESSKSRSDRLDCGLARAGGENCHDIDTIKHLNDPMHGMWSQRSPRSLPTTVVHNITGDPNDK